MQNDASITLGEEFDSNLSCGIWVKIKASFFFLSLSTPPSGEWEGVVQIQPRWDCGGLPSCQGPRRGAGHQAYPERPPPRPPSGNPCGGCVHSDRHHLWTHHGAGKAPAFNPSCAWRLSLPALWQVCTIHGHVGAYFYFAAPLQKK